MPKRHFDIATVIAVLQYTSLAPFGNTELTFTVFMFLAEYRFGHPSMQNFSVVIEIP